MTIKSHRILGIDPGTNILGFAVIEVNASAVQVLEVDVVSMGHLEDQQQKLRRIFERLQEIIVHYQPGEMAIEAPFFAKNVQSMLKLGRAQGVAIAAAMMKDVPVTEYSPKKIKQAITGNGNASKEQVAAMLKQILRIDLDNKYLDASDALATALCHHYQNRTITGGKKRYGNWDSFLKDNPDKLG